MLQTDVRGFVARRGQDLSRHVYAGDRPDTSRLRTIQPPFLRRHLRRRDGCGNDRRRRERRSAKFHAGRAGGRSGDRRPARYAASRSDERSRVRGVAVARRCPGRVGRRHHAHLGSRQVDPQRRPPVGGDGLRGDRTGSLCRHGRTRRRRCFRFLNLPSVC